MLPERVNKLFFAKIANIFYIILKRIQANKYNIPVIFIKTLGFI